MWEQFFKMVLQKIDPVVAAAFITRCNNALIVQERIAKAQEESNMTARAALMVQEHILKVQGDIAFSLADLIETRKTTNILLDGILRHANNVGPQ